jgi:hypothetical protein
MCLMYQVRKGIYYKYRKEEGKWVTLPCSSLSSEVGTQLIVYFTTNLFVYHDHVYFQLHDSGQVNIIICFFEVNLEQCSKILFPMNFIQKTKTLSIKFLTLIKVVCARSIKCSITVPHSIVSPFSKKFKTSIT